MHEVQRDEHVDRRRVAHDDPDQLPFECVQEHAQRRGRRVLGVGRFLLDDHALRRRGTRRPAGARFRADARFGLEERRRRVPGALSFSRARVEPAMRSPYYSLHLSCKVFHRRLSHEYSCYGLGLVGGSPLARSRSELATLVSYMPLVTSF